MVQVKIEEIIKELEIFEREKLLFRTGFLRNSLDARIEGENIIFYSLAKYAKIHNEGGKITHPGGTAYYYDKKKKKIVFVRNITAEIRGGYKRTRSHDIEIEKRQFAGWHPELQKEIDKEIERFIKEIFR